jgi:serine/threonine protein kinase
MGDGAFSNVYKAVERKSGRKVAVKVVRKYELNSSQVRILSYSPFTTFVHIKF